ncbi:hypothetical protein [Roseisolibacter sp. H3M3-2]|uniref:hypothetical protein n=1 Tax=Roseisolibacter sp. H3M3-2 TaxID=3031323 RepID=UPI0023DA2E31|nr:hypothetical protein [Roseisolibacter sp. H3M3-2]MDF1505121.1 hypothetical protein [Roseisolibacter sp. H3M3-2]
MVRLSDAGPPDDGPPDGVALAALQAAVVRSAVGGAPLPGGAPPIALPDAVPPAGDGATLLLDEALPAGLSGLLLRGVRLVRPDALRRDAAALRGATFLRLAPASDAGALTRVALEVWRDPGDGTRWIALGGVQVAARRAGDGWRVAEPPRAFAV